MKKVKRNRLKQRISTHIKGLRFYETMAGPQVQWEAMWYDLEVLTLALEEKPDMQYFLTIDWETSGATKGTESKSDLRRLPVFNIHALSPCLHLESWAVHLTLLCPLNHKSSIKEPRTLESKVWLKLGRIIFFQKRKESYKNNNLYSTIQHQSKFHSSFVFLQNIL